MGVAGAIDSNGTSEDVGNSRSRLLTAKELPGVYLIEPHKQPTWGALKHMMTLREGKMTMIVLWTE